VKASRRPPVKTVAMMTVQAAVPLPGAKSALQRKPEALQALACHDSIEGVEEQLFKKGTILPELGKPASHKCQTHKRKEGVTLKKETPLIEKEREQPTANRSDGDGACKGPVVRTKEIMDVYSLKAPSSVATALTTFAQDTAPSKPTVEASQKKSTKETPKLAVVASQDQTTIQVRSIESSLIPCLPINSGTSKLLVFNVHGTLLDCSMMDEKNPNTKIRPSALAVHRRIIFRPWMAEFLNHCFFSFEVAFWDSKSAKYMQDMVPILLGRLKGAESCAPALCGQPKNASASNCRMGPSWKGQNHWRQSTGRGLVGMPPTPS
jgi:hypothetical protein